MKGKMSLYRERIDAILREILEECAVVVSEATADGGRAGVMSELRREVAAQYVVDGKARLATAEEAAEYRREMLVRQEEFQRRASSDWRQVQVTVRAAREKK
jgi:hypothetical protein